MLRLIVSLFVVVAMALAFAPPANAQDAARAAEQRKRADELMDSYKYTEALDLYAQSYATTKDPALLYNMGRGHEALGQYPEALEKLERFERDATPELRAKVPGLAQRIADVRAHVSTLLIHANVPGARVLLSNRALGTTPLPGPIKANAGRATVEVLADGYQPFRQEIELKGGASATIEANLVSRDTSAVLRVQSPTVGAEVEIDGKPAGTVPAEIVLAAGSHPVVVHKGGYETASTSVVVSAGEHRTISIPLDSSKAITQRWWFWTGIGVIVVAGAVTTYALLTERPADKGTYPPGQVAGPLVRF
jgi:PEGA domain